MATNAYYNIRGDEGSVIIDEGSPEKNLEIFKKEFHYLADRIKSVYIWYDPRKVDDPERPEGEGYRTLTCFGDLLIVEVADMTAGTGTKTDEWTLKIVAAMGFKVSGSEKDVIRHGNPGHVITSLRIDK
jgi:hypothetical protein